METAMKMKYGRYIPEGKSGPWEIQTFTVGESDSRLSQLRDGYRAVHAGTYQRLVRARHTTVMSNTRAEYYDHFDFISQAEGKVLINGLGLGMTLHEILKKGKCEQITVIEKSSDVITLVAQHFPETNVEIIQADAFEFSPPKGVRYDAVWHDIWDGICSDNLKEMATLHRKYGRKTNWQGSWCKAECLRQCKRNQQFYY